MSSENDEFNKEQFSVKKRVSIVWNYFEKLNRYRVRCKICMHEQNYQGTTGNILRHLKNKHSIDATLKGQNGHPDLKRLLDSTDVEKISNGEEKKEEEDGDEEFDVIVKTEHNGVNIGTMPHLRRETRSKLVSLNDELDLNPYAEKTGMEFTDYIEPHLVETPRRKLSFSNNQNDDSTPRREKQRTSVLEERLIAEIEYFREKAAYYRMQKNLTSLQAKKVRYELNQMG